MCISGTRLQLSLALTSPRDGEQSETHGRDSPCLVPHYWAINLMLPVDWERRSWELSWAVELLAQISQHHAETKCLLHLWGFFEETIKLVLSLFFTLRAEKLALSRLYPIPLGTLL